MDLEEMGIDAGNWVDSAQDRDSQRALVNAALNLRELVSQCVPVVQNQAQMGGQYYNGP